MASPVSALTHAPAQPLKTAQIVRRSAAFHPSVWGDSFLQLSHDEKVSTTIITLISILICGYACFNHYKNYT